MSTMLSRSTPLFPTYPMSHVVFLKISRWYETFHCQLFGVLLDCSRPDPGAPSVVAKQPSHG
jgi:hypothetical protein